jgi:hypothetical protein
MAKQDPLPPAPQDFWCLAVCRPRGLSRQFIDRIVVYYFRYVGAFLTTLTLSLAYYHRRWKLGVGGAMLFSILPFSVNVLWARFSHRSLVYPMVGLGFLGILILATIHRNISEPRWDGDIEDRVRKELIADVDSNVTWKDRVTWLCFACAAILSLILLFR